MIGKKRKTLCGTKNKFGYKFKKVTTNEPISIYIYIYIYINGNLMQKSMALFEKRIEILLSHKIRIKKYRLFVYLV